MVSRRAQCLVLASGLAAFLYPVGPGCAQGGGTVGAPAQSEPRKPVSAPPKAERPPPGRLEGTWRVNQECSAGKFEILLAIRHQSPAAFTGDSVGVTTKQRSRIVEGRLDGNTIRFTRRLGNLSDRWTAELTSAARFVGTSKGPLWTCTYTAVRG